MPTAYSLLGLRSVPKISMVQNAPLSSLEPYGTLLFVSTIITLVVLANVLERWLLRAIYGKVYINLQCSGHEKQRRSFTYYHIGAIATSVVLCVGFYPAMKFIAGSAVLSTSIATGSQVQVGDLLFIISQIYTAYYTFELCYRTQFASPLGIAHHTGLIAIMQTSLLLFHDLEKHPEATIEFYMCMVWGSFDAIVELPIFISMIIWRKRRNESKLLAYMTGGLCVWVVVGASTEVIVTIYLLYQSWDRWGNVWKFVTPFIFSLWISTQLYGASRLYSMSKSERQKYKMGELHEVEPIVELHEILRQKDTTNQSDRAPTDALLCRMEQEVIWSLLFTDDEQFEALSPETQQKVLGMFASLSLFQQMQDSLEGQRRAKQAEANAKQAEADWLAGAIHVCEDAKRQAEEEGIEFLHSVSLIDDDVYLSMRRDNY
ncbi:hypothetical protein CcaCcLH18_14096 [Colletotrichum camelliae]|nr:hypothetical protein CcaCcLH18_14096 [Colletotrichum camelliae]